MKFNLLIVLVTCLSCSLTQVDSTGLLGAKIAAGVKGAALLGSSALAVKGKILKGVGTLLEAKGAMMHNVHNAIADTEQEPPATVAREKPTYVYYQQGKPPIPSAVASIQTHPINFRTIEDRPMEIHSVRLVPFDEIPMKLYATEKWPLGRHFMEIHPVKTRPTEPQPFHIKFAQFKKNTLLGLFKTMHGAVINKKRPS